ANESSTRARQNEEARVRKAAVATTASENVIPDDPEYHLLANTETADQTIHLGQFANLLTRRPASDAGTVSPSWLTRQVVLRPDRQASIPRTPNRILAVRKHHRIAGFEHYLQ